MSTQEGAKAGSLVRDSYPDEQCVTEGWLPLGLKSVLDGSIMQSCGVVAWIGGI